MKKTKWSEYDKFLVLADNANGKLTVSYDSFLRFKEVLQVINGIAFSDKTNYLYNDNIYNRKITITEAKRIVANVDECRWNSATEMMFLVSNQIGLRI